MPRGRHSALATLCLVFGCIAGPGMQVALVRAQPAPAAVPATGQPAAPTDSLGRTTPRGTVLGFLNSARDGKNELARQYLDTRLSPKQAEERAHQLFVVLDVRLPARLTQLSDTPEGSGTNPLTPNQEVVGTIAGPDGPVDIVVERLDRGKAGQLWLFSGRTLEAVPALYEEIVADSGATPIRRFMTRTRAEGFRLFEWLSVLLGVIALYAIATALNRVLTPLIGRAWNALFGRVQPWRGDALPVPARLLLLALVARWLLSMAYVSIFVRQFWSNAASLVTIVSVVWLLVLLNGVIEDRIRRRMPRGNVIAAVSLLRLLRRAADVLVIFAGLLATLRLFVIDATPALAGLGVGGIAVALAAQKTLENVVAGASLIFDQAVRIGDFLRMGDVTGTVDHIGLRSTRIRTLDRTIVSIPNSQIANASLETLSMRDKFWFHPEVRLRYDTTPQQLRAVLDGIRGLLGSHPSVDSESTHVRFIRLGPFSFDIEVFAYLLATDWSHFLQIQEQLLFGITDVVERAGTGLALPSQTMYMAGERDAPALSSLPGDVG